MRNFFCEKHNMAQSMATPMSMQELQNCFVNCGRWAYAQGGTALTKYQEFYNEFLAAESGINTATPVQPQRQRQSRAANQPTANQPTADKQPTGRQRTPPGILGESSARVLARIIADPRNTTAEALQNHFVRTKGLDGAQRVGVALGNLWRKGLITGTERKGPFTATQAGIEMNSKEPRPITSRQRSRKTTTPTAAGEQAAA
jgi:hypothetical protein